MTLIATPAQPNAIELGTGPLPDAKNPEAWHKQYGSHFARNVTVATLTPFLPDPAKASGAAVVVAPGGGFRTLSMGQHWDTHRFLAEGPDTYVLGGCSSSGTGYTNRRADLSVRIGACPRFAPRLDRCVSPIHAHWDTHRFLACTINYLPAERSLERASTLVRISLRIGACPDHSHSHRRCRPSHRDRS